jgi:hypothetical protein
VAPLLVLELEEEVVTPRYALCIGAHAALPALPALPDVSVEVVGGHEALVLVLIGLGLADMDILAGRSCKLLLEELVFGDEVVESAVLGGLLVLLLAQVELVLPQKLVGVLLERHCLLRFDCIVALLLVIDTPEDILVSVPHPSEQRIINFDKLQHLLFRILGEIIIMRNTVIFIGLSQE